MDMELINMMKKYKFFDLVIVLTLIAAPSLAMAYLEKVPPLKTQPSSAGDIVFKVESSHKKVLKNESFDVLFTFEVPQKKSDKKLPLNTSIVIDRSGSMAEKGKLEYAKAAAKEFINRLDSEDRVSLVCYDDKIEILSEPVMVGNHRSELLKKVDLLEPRGATNLAGGMMEGAKQIQAFIDDKKINRVLLLSDGLANEGVTSLSEVAALAESLSKKGVQVTTFGMGADFDEDMMTRIADASGGNYYFIESAAQTAGIFEKERYALSSVVGRKSSITLTLPEDVSLIDIYGYSYKKHGNLVTVDLPDFFSGQKRKIVASLKTSRPEGFQVELLKAAFGYTEAGTQKEIASVQLIKADVTTSGKDHEESANKDVVAEAGRAIANNQVNEAMKSYKSGDKDKANSLLGEAKKVLERSYQAAPSATLQDDMKDVDQATDGIMNNSPESESGKIIIKSNKEEARTKQQSY